MNPDYLKILVGSGGCLSMAMAEGEEVELQVAGECMEPALGHQTSVRLKRPRFFVPGDIVAFHCPHQGRLIVHRFLGYVFRRSAWKLMTMADQGTRPDSLVDAPCVLGRVTAQDGREYRISPIARLDAIRRYALWCSLHFARRLIS